MPKRVAAIYDIHGNFFALEAVLADVNGLGVDSIVIGGDLAWGPQPVEVLERLMNFKGDIHFLCGNADREVAQRYGTKQGLRSMVAEVNEWCADQLSREQIQFLKALPEQKVLHIDGFGEILFVHGSPRSDEEAIRLNTSDEDTGEMIEGVTQNTIVCGHTHVPFDRKVNGKRILNPGSAGLPVGTANACWALIEKDITLKQTAYSVEKAARKIRDSNVPYAEKFATHLLNPPSEGP